MSTDRPNANRRAGRALAVAGVTLVAVLNAGIAYAAPNSQSGDVVRLDGAAHVVADGAAIVLPVELRCSTPDSSAYVSVTQVVTGRVVSGQGQHPCSADLIHAQVLVLPALTYPPTRGFRPGPAFVNATVGSAGLHRTVSVTPTDTAQFSSPGIVLPSSMTLQAGGPAVRGMVRLRCPSDGYPYDVTLVQVAAQRVHATRVYLPCPAASGLLSLPVWFFTSQPGPAWHAGPAVLMAGNGVDPVGFRVVTINTGSR